MAAVVVFIVAFDVCNGPLSALNLFVGDIGASGV